MTAPDRPGPRLTDLRNRSDRPNPTMPPSLRWDIFCRVVDNYGDSGVVLAPGAAARRRTRPRGHAVDRRRRDPRAHRARARSRAATTRSRAACACVAPATRIPPCFSIRTSSIEAFGCGLPGFVSRGHGRRRRDRRCGSTSNTCRRKTGSKAAHTLPSPHPLLPLTCWFYFPGFTPRHRRLAAREGAAPLPHAFQRDPSRARRCGARSASSRANPR